MRGKIADLKIYKKESPMSNKNIIRAWKDPVYRNSLSESERATLPPNPAGAIEISDADLGGAVASAQSHNASPPANNTTITASNSHPARGRPDIFPNVMVSDAGSTTMARSPRKLASGVGFS